MPVNWSGLWKVAQAVFGMAEASRQFLGPSPSRPEEPHDAADAGLTHHHPAAGMLGHLETRLTGIVVSALKEAFDRDAARLDLERAMLEDQRRRAEEALRLELVRQAGERTASRLRAVGALALGIWAVSVLFVMRFPDGFAGGARIVLGAGWLSLLGAVAASFAAHAQVGRWVTGAVANKAAPESVPEGGAAALAPWLTLAGLTLVGVSLLLAL